MPNSYIDPPASIAEFSGVNQQIVTGSCVLYGIVLCDEGAANVKVHLHNGTSTSGEHVAALDIPSNGAGTIWYGPNGVHCPDGIYCEVITGTAVGSVFFSP